MTLRWRICFSLLAAVMGVTSHAADVTGRVKLVNSHDSSSHKSPDYSGVVIWLESGAPAPARPTSTTILQEDKRFTPHILAIQVGSKVDFPNADPIFHNAFSTFNGQIFDIGLYPPGTSRQVAFHRAGIVRVFCNIHPLMSAVIVVTPTPWFATTGEDGRFRIEGVPAGPYRLRVFHERALPETLAALEHDIDITDDGLAVGTIEISEAGYAPVPHLNKHGQEYPPPVDGHLVYPGVQQ